MSNSHHKEDNLYYYILIVSHGKLSKVTFPEILKGYSQKYVLLYNLYSSVHSPTIANCWSSKENIGTTWKEFTCATAWHCLPAKTLKMFANKESVSLFIWES